MKVHKRLKEMRKRANLTQDKLAEVIHVSRQTISNWENGKSYPDIQSLILLCEIYNISLNQLIGEDIIKMKVTVKKGRMYLFSFMLVFLVILFFVCITAVKSMGYVAFTLAGISLTGIFLTSLKIERFKNDFNCSNYKLIREYLNNKEKRC
ncbi:transcriptional regulator [Bacillus cereus]|nr:transcriptional regulator [Bacillus cereus]